MPSAPPEAAANRFLNDFLESGGRTDQPVGLAVSGGPDSLALLLLAHATLPQLAVATVDHGLRKNGADEARFVADLCEELGIPIAILTLGPPTRGNVSVWARHQRYGALVQWMEDKGISQLMTAHHADDQLETMIMRLNRGSGVAGLAGVRAKRDGLIRPLLGWRKTELEALVRDAGISPVDDPTNRDDRFDRARLRKALAGADWLDPVAASRSAAALAEAEAALAWTATAYENRRCAEQNGIVSFDHRNLPRELQRRIVLACLAKINQGIEPRGEELDRLIAGLKAGRIATLAGVKCEGGDFWLFSLAPARNPNRREI
jgi:tRNA(Ile)-lysidine synthase